MRILVIGGTYFLGKAFVHTVCREAQVTMLHRGSRKVAFPAPENVREMHRDRHSLTKGCLVGSGAPEYDVVVDFCAYEKGDIRQVLEALEGKVKQYVFVSTSDVYARGSGAPVDERSPLETRDYGGAAGAYILGKTALEQELKECAEEYHIFWTSVRPVFLYGPDNYAPREGIFFHWLREAGQVIFPKDADGSFQMVYVQDAAEILQRICGNEALYDRAVNLCGPQIVTYESFCDALEEAVGEPFQRVELLCREIQDRQIPLPFPLTKEESEQYVSLVAEQIPETYRSLAEGLKETWAWEQENRLFEQIDALFDANRPKDAERFMLAELEKAKAADRAETTLKLYNELIGYYRQTSEREKLLEVIGESLRLLEHMRLEGTISYATTTLNIANAYRSLGERDLSRKYYHMTEETYQKQIERGSLAGNDMLLAGLYNNISLLYQEDLDPKTAEAYLYKALEIVTQNQAGFEIAVTHANLANTYVMAKDYDRAKEQADTAIRLFKARGLRDPHYCAALAALGTCFYEQGAYRQAQQIFEEACRIVEETFGQNSQYIRLQGNLEKCREKLGGQPQNGMALARSYYETYGAPMIHEKFPAYEGQIAVGFAGEGSDCFGYDDTFSADHDYGPDFCMWLSDETYDAIGEALQKAYEELPVSFMGFTRNTTPMGKGRRGVQKISAYYQKFVGTDRYEEIDFTQVEDSALAACTNGEVFKDEEGLFTAMREKLLEGLPGRIRLLKLAQDAAGFSQCGQYNYARMMQRGDMVSAGIELSDALKHAMKLYHHLLNVYPPHDKWLYKSTTRLPHSADLVLLLDQAMYKFGNAEPAQAILDVFEKMGEWFAARLYESGEISDVDAYLDHHVEELLFKAGIADCSDKELVDKIVRLEFEAFDKVQNEGGRASCQNNWPTFRVMRMSQYLTWNRKMLVQYFYDFTREYERGHNLITEKYGRMMESTAPARYAEIKDNFPALTEEKKAVIEQIVGIQMEMVETFSQVHPKVINNARTLHTYDDTAGDTSYETYLRGEISTYSDKMLQLYGAYVVNAAKIGENIAARTMENTAKLYGFRDLEAFEAYS